MSLFQKIPAAEVQTGWQVIARGGANYWVTNVTHRHVGKTHWVIIEFGLNWGPLGELALMADETVEARDMGADR